MYGLCLFSYNGDFEQVACCIRIPLDRIDRIVVGMFMLI